MSLNAKKPALAFTRTGDSISDQRIQAASQDVHSVDHEAANEKQKPVAFPLVWQGVLLVRLPQGVYQGTCVNTQGPEKIRRFGRWSLRLGFWIHREDVEISMFLNFGRGDRPEVKRNSKFFKAWCVANGAPPKLGQHMLPGMFMNKRFSVRVEDATLSAELQKNPDGTLSKDRAPKKEGEIYSRVIELLRLIHS
jgi:hypothetical protein